LSADKLQDAIQNIEKLPTLPSVLGQILDAADDPEASALDLGQFIAADQSLSANILRIVNSAYYSFPGEVTSVARAIVILGFVEVRNLALTATAFQALPKTDSDFDRAQLWRHAMGSAIAASRLARKLKLNGVGDHFTAGLLHDIGKVTLDVLYPEQYMETARRARKEGQYLRDAEAEDFGFTHADAGGMLAAHWNLPASVADAIRYHHAPTESKTAPNLTCLTALANYVTYLAGTGEVSNGKPPVFPARAAAHLKISEEVCGEVAEDVASARERIDSLIGPLDEIS